MSNLKDKKIDFPNYTDVSSIRTNYRGLVRKCEKLFDIKRKHVSIEQISNVIKILKEEEGIYSFYIKIGREKKFTKFLDYKSNDLSNFIRIESNYLIFALDNEQENSVNFIFMNNVEYYESCNEIKKVFVENEV